MASAVANVYAPVDSSTEYCPAAGVDSTRIKGTAFALVTPRSATKTPAFGGVGVTVPPTGTGVAVSERATAVAEPVDMA